MNDLPPPPACQPGNAPSRKLRRCCFSDLTDSRVSPPSLEAEGLPGTAAASATLYEDVVPRCHGGADCTDPGRRWLWPSSGTRAARVGRNGVPRRPHRSRTAAQIARLDIPMHGRRCFTDSTAASTPARCCLRAAMRARGRFDVTGAAITYCPPGLAMPGQVSWWSARRPRAGVMRFRNWESASHLCQVRLTRHCVYRVLGRQLRARRRRGAWWRRRAASRGRTPRWPWFHARLRRPARVMPHLTITVPAGVGKTRLAREFTGSSRRTTRSRSRECEGRYSSAPLQPFPQMPRPSGHWHGYAGQRGTRVRPSRTLTASVNVSRITGTTWPGAAVQPGSDGSQPVAGEQLVRSTVHLRALSSHRLLVLFVDDSQWQTTLSRRVLEFPAR